MLFVCSSLIALAIQNSPDQKLTLGEIYSSIMKTFPYYRRVEKTGWQNSIRHNLSIHKAFVRKGESGGRTGGYWTIDPNMSVGSFKKIRRVGKQTTSTTKVQETSNQVSTQTNESFWEPDPDTFEDAPTSNVETAKPTTSSINVTSNIDRRKSIEEFLQMGFGRTPEKGKVKILSALDIPSTQVVVATKSFPNSSTSELQKAMAVDESVDKNRPPFMGSVDYYEQVSIWNKLNFVVFIVQF